MRAWQFTQKTPGFGISSSFYLTVLAAKAALPTLHQIANPNAEDGAVEGFAIPIAKEAGKESLLHPIERGAYALSTRDRKTIVKMLVVSKEEAGYDPEAFVRSAQAESVDHETVDRIRATWTLLQLTFETHHPMVAESIYFLHRIAQRLAELTDGVVADPISQTYLLPENVPVDAPAKGLNAQDVVRTFHRERAQRQWVFTHGMEKFALPELEMFEVPEEHVDLAERFVLGICQAILNGKKIPLGAKLGSPKAPIQMVQGGLERGAWEGIECHELIPPTGQLIEDALQAWESEVSA